MSKPLYKVGDMVRILDGKNISNYTGSWNPSGMGKFIGKEAIISKVYDIYDEGRFGYRLSRIDGCDISSWLTWDERGLEPVEDDIIDEVSEDDILAFIGGNYEI